MSMTFLPPIILAILLQEVPKGKILFRSIYYLPAVVTGIVTVLLWKMFYAQSEKGMLNSVVLSVPAIGFIALGLLFLVVCFMFAARLRFYKLRWQMAAFVLAGLAICYACISVTFPIMIHKDDTILQTLCAIPGRLFDFLPEPYNWLSDPVKDYRNIFNEPAYQPVIAEMRPRLDKWTQEQYDAHPLTDIK